MDNRLPTYDIKCLNCIKYSGWGYVLFFIVIQVFYLLYSEKFNDNPGFLFNIILSFISLFMTVSVHTFTLLHGAALCVCAAKLYFNLNENMMKALSSLTDCYLKDDKNLRILEYHKEDTIKEELEYCRLLHLRIWSFTQTVSEYLSSQLYVVTTTEFLNICYHLYQGITSMMNGNNDIKTLCVLFGASITSTALIAIISYAVDVQTDQHDKTAEILNWCKVSCKSNELSSFISRFSLQVLQMRPTLTSVGFFSVDRVFLLAMIGNVCNYVVILIGFNNVDPPTVNATNALGNSTGIRTT